MEFVSRSCREIKVSAKVAEVKGGKMENKNSWKSTHSQPLQNNVVHLKTMTTATITTTTKALYITQPNGDCPFRSIFA